MMKHLTYKSMRLGWILIVFFGFTGCYDQAAEVDLPTYNKRTVITSYLSPKDQNITVEVTYIVPYFGKQIADVTRVGDATVVVSDMTVGKSVQLPFDSSIMLYRIRAFALPIVNDHEYRIDVIMKDGTTHWSKTRIPPALKEADLKVGKFVVGKLEESNWGGQSVSASLEMIAGNTQTGFYYSPQFEMVLEDGNGDFYGSLLYFPNEGIEAGKTGDALRYLFNDRIYIDQFSGGSPALDPLILKEVVGTFWVMDEGYKERYVREMQISDNPFAEPILMYSNWSNGAIGALGSYDWVEAVITP